MEHWIIKVVHLNVFNKEIELQESLAIEPIPNLRDEIEINDEFFWVSRKTFNYEKKEIKLTCMKSDRKY